MLTILKFALFIVFIYAIGLAGFRLYKMLNAKIEGSRTLGELALYALLMIAANIGLLFGGLILFLYVYDYLSL